MPGTQWAPQRAAVSTGTVGVSAGQMGLQSGTSWKPRVQASAPYSCSPPGEVKPGSIPEETLGVSALRKQAAA